MTHGVCCRTPGRNSALRRTIEGTHARSAEHAFHSPKSAPAAQTSRRPIPSSRYSAANPYNVEPIIRTERHRQPETEEARNTASGWRACESAFVAQCIPTGQEFLDVPSYKAFLARRRTLISARLNEFLGS
jgi:hypothetical protein